jgi:uncharacterized membrane protein
MAVLNGTYQLTLGQPWWLLTALLAVPMAVLAWRSLAALGRGRQIVAVALRTILVVLLAALLAQPALTRKSQQVTLLAVLDRSQSVPQNLQKGALAFLAKALEHRRPLDRLAVVDVAESADISKLPAGDSGILERNTNLAGTESKLSAGVEMAMAIVPPDTAARILLVSDGNETAGDLRDAARAAGANGIPIDVLPLRYHHSHEVVFTSLVAPVKARSGQTVPLRMILNSVAPAKGKLMLSLNGKSVDLLPDCPALPVELQAGTNVKTVSLPLGTKGMHEFVASFVADDPSQDSIPQNNQASAITFVAGPGHVLAVDNDSASASAIIKALRDSQIDVRYCSGVDFPTRLAELLDCDAIILANVDSPTFSYQQQEMLCRYVNEIGGGLVMVGGTTGFGAGGWIGSPLAEVMPVDMDPPQKKQMPKGALVLIMHACEMPQGNYWGKQVAIAAVNTLSRLDLAGVLDFGWQEGNANWVWPLGELGDKKGITSAIEQMQMGDMPDFGAPMQAAYDKLTTCNAAVKHVIIISDGDPQMPSNSLLGLYKQAGISCTGISVFPHGSETLANLANIAQATGGRFYDVKDPASLPQIFIKEAQVVRRSLINEDTFAPQTTFAIHEILRGLPGVPNLDGLVLTGPKGGLAQMIMTNDKGDPLLAAMQSGLGRTVAFTSAADGRWGAGWLAWGGFGRFWEQLVRWVGKPSQSSDCEVFADVQGRTVTLTVESADQEGKSVQLAQLAGQVIAPDMSTKEVPLTQVGPGRYRGEYQASGGGSFLVNLRYRKVGQDASAQAGLMQTAVNIPYAPEYRSLADNASLLSAVAASTGGRVLQSDKPETDLFDRANLLWPKSSQPITEPLLFIALAILLLDVAVRRIAVDFRAIGGRIVATGARLRRRGHAADERIGRLNIKRKEFLDQLASRQKSTTASNRYKAPASSQALKMPQMPGLGEEPPTGQATHQARPTADEKPRPADATSLQQLLAAKRKAQDHRKKDSKDSSEETTGDK